MDIKIPVGSVAVIKNKEGKMLAIIADKNEEITVCVRFAQPGGEYDKPESNFIPPRKLCGPGRR